MVEAVQDGNGYDRPRRLRDSRRLWNSLPEALMRAGCVEGAIAVFGKDPSDVTLVEDQNMVERLALYAAEIAFADRIHIRGANRGLDDAAAGSLGIFNEQVTARAAGVDRQAECRVGVGDRDEPFSQLPAEATDPGYAATD
jgi:hypothetical protein